MRIRLVQTACQHIRIEGLTGEILAVITLEELKSPISGREDRITTAMKYFVRNHFAHGGAPSFEALKTLLEDSEF